MRTRTADGRACHPARQRTAFDRSPFSGRRASRTRILLIALAAAAAWQVFPLSLPSLHAEDSVTLYLADGFDFPVGWPNAYGYYRARGYWPGGHHGEDWNGRGGGNTDLGDAIYSIADGVVVFSKDHKMGWGNVVIVRHAYRETDGKIHYIDALHGHLQKRFVELHDTVARGEKIGTMGSNRGMYLAHLHFEIRKNLRIGMLRTKYKNDYSNYHDPTKFIRAHRQLRTDFARVPIPLYPFNQSTPAYPERPQVKIPAPAPPPPPKKEPAESEGEEGSEDGAPAEPPDTLKPEVERVLKNYQTDEKKDVGTFWEHLKKQLREDPASAAPKPEAKPADDGE